MSVNVYDLEADILELKSRVDTLEDVVQQLRNTLLAKATYPYKNWTPKDFARSQGLD